MLTATATARLRVTAGVSDKGEADRARARRIKKGLSEFAAQEKAYAQGQYRWVARQHARAQSALKRGIEELKAEWQEEPEAPDDGDLWVGDGKTSDRKTK